MIDRRAIPPCDRERRRVTGLLREIKSGSHPYLQWEMTLQDAVDSTRESGYPWPPPEDDPEGGADA